MPLSPTEVLRKVPLFSGLGEADYHEIEVAGSRIFALRNEDPEIGRAHV